VYLSQAFSPKLVRPLKSVKHGQCDARPTIICPAAERHHPSTDAKLDFLVTRTQGYEQLAQSCYAAAPDRESNPRPLDRQSDAEHVVPPRHASRSSVLIVVLLHNGPLLCQLKSQRLTQELRWPIVAKSRPKFTAVDIEQPDESLPTLTPHFRWKVSHSVAG